MPRSNERREKIVRAAIAANPDIEPLRVQKIVQLTLAMAYARPRKR